MSHYIEKVTVSLDLNTESLREKEMEDISQISPMKVFANL